MKARSGIALALSVAAICALPASASAADQIWWSNYSPGGVAKVGLPGGAGSGANVFSGAPEVYGPYGTAADPASGKVYWINYDNRRIYSGNLDGSGTPQVVLDSTVSGPISTPYVRPRSWSSCASSRELGKHPDTPNLPLVHYPRTSKPRVSTCPLTWVPSGLA